MSKAKIGEHCTTHKNCKNNNCVNGKCTRKNKKQAPFLMPAEKEDKDKAIKYEKEIDRGEKFVEHFSSNDSTKESRTNIKKLIYNNKDLISKTKEKTVKK